MGASAAAVAPFPALAPHRGPVHCSGGSLVGWLCPFSIDDSHSIYWLCVTLVAKAYGQQTNGEGGYPNPK